MRRLTLFVIVALALASCKEVPTQEVDQIKRLSPAEGLNNAEILTFHRCSKDATSSGCGSLEVELSGGIVYVRLRNLEGAISGLDPQRWWRGVSFKDPCIESNDCTSQGIFGPDREISTPNDPNLRGAELTLLGSADALGDIGTVVPFVSVQGGEETLWLFKSLTSAEPDGTFRQEW